MQNRVDPFGEIISTRARGSWMGNRGILHNEKQEIIRPYKLKAWIICKLEFKGRKRQVMTPNNYTELFFLDEATAFAAGHRPCFECRREDASRFKELWIQANPEFNFDSKTSVHELDKILNMERKNKDGAKKAYEESPVNLPDGTFLSIQGSAYLLYKERLYQWSPFGYKASMQIPKFEKVSVLTPGSIVKTFRAGYTPQIDTSVITATLA